MVLIEIGNQFYRTRDLRIDQVSPVRVDEEEREMRVISHKHEVAEHKERNAEH